MQYKAQTIAPKGRMEFGNYLSSGNVTKMVNSTVYGGNTTTNDLGGGNTEKKEDSPVESNWSVFLSKTYNTFDKITIAEGEGDDDIYVIGYKGTEKAGTFIGDLNDSTAAHSGITGIPAGMTVTCTGNGTTGTSLNILVESTCEETGGTLSIPVYVNISKALNEVGTTWSEWKDNEAQTVHTTLSYSWKITANAEIYSLDLSNENAGVNVDKNGVIYSASVQTLACTASLVMGSEPVTSATYSLSILPRYNCTGVSINASTGVLSWTTGGFRFDGNNLPINVIATVEGVTVGTKTMNINKNWPGTDGQDAVTKWIVLSSDSAKVDKNNTPTPSVITAQVMKQVGGNAPEVTTAETIYYSYDSVNPTTVLPNTGATVLTGSSKINFVLRKGNTTAGTIYESETVPIMKDGKDGAKGDTGDAGRTGAAIRGPIKWEDGGNRRWCNGEGPTTADTQWIDICIYNNQYYRCITSYNGTTSQTWAQVSSNWEQAAAEYNFVAAKLILAQNAGIDFLTGNEIYLKNNAGQITGGARGSDTANTVNFWAGASSPSSAPFQVYNDGSIKANKGTFAGAVQMPYTHITELSIGNTGYIADSRTNIVVNIGGGNAELVLPEPSSTYNGVTYHLLVVPSAARSKMYPDAAEVYVRTTNLTRSFVVCTYSTPYSDGSDTANTINRLAFFGGNVVLTCVPYTAGNYKWVLTECTGGVDIYNGNTYSMSLNTIMSYSKQGITKAVNKIMTDTSMPATKDTDTLYISRS